MKKKNIVLASFVALTILASSGVMAFAATGTTTGTGITGAGFGGARGAGGPAIFENLTDAQKTQLHEDRAAELKTAMTNLVADGVFTQAEADAYIAATPTTPPTDRVEKGNAAIQALTADQSAALQAKIKLLSADSLKALVAAGTITQAQADDMALRGDNPMDGQGRGHGPGNVADIKTAPPVQAQRANDLTEAQRTALHDSRVAFEKAALVELVTEGVITQAEADAIIAETPTAPPAERTANANDPIQSLTDAQRTALQTEMQTLEAAHLKELVAAGTITQEQADQMALRGPGHMDGPGRGHAPDSSN
jgi:Spy/CpxP family protein refolding chaperone